MFQSLTQLAVTDHSCAGFCSWTHFHIADWNREHGLLPRNAQVSSLCWSSHQQETRNPENFTEHLAFSSSCGHSASPSPCQQSTLISLTPHWGRILSYWSQGPKSCHRWRALRQHSRLLWSRKEPSCTAYSGGWMLLCKANSFCGDSNSAHVSETGWLDQPHPNGQTNTSHFSPKNSFAQPPSQFKNRNLTASEAHCLNFL